MPPRPRREASAERLQQLLTRTYEKHKSIVGADDLRDFAMEEEEDAEDKLNPTYAEVRAFLGEKERSQVFKKVDEEWPSRIRKPLRPGVHFAIDDLDDYTNARPAWLQGAAGLQVHALCD